MSKKLICLASFILVLAAAPLVTHAQMANLLLNPSFEEDEDINAGPQWWTWAPAEGAGSTATIVDTEFVDGARGLRVEPQGSENWHFYVVQTVPLNVGTTYTYSFWAKAEADRPLTVNFKSLDNSSTWELTDFQLTTEWAEYHITGPSQSADVKLEILCAAAGTPFWLDFAYVYDGPYIAGILPGGEWRPVKAADPDPVDGAVLTNFPGGLLGTNLMWTPGDFAVSHDVYFGDNFDDVNDGTGGTFQGNQTAAYFLAGYGYTQNDPLPTGFVPGSTYYWRVDEVNDLDPNSPWKGDVWSFSLPPTKAHIPIPIDGSKFVDPNADLNWEIGLGAIEQTVYFGDDYDTVDTATEGGTLVGRLTTYDPGPLELEKVYYWRVDTVGAFGPAPGDTWSFRTLPDIPLTSDPNLMGWWKLDEDPGTTALDWSGRGNHGTLVGDPQWTDGYDGYALEFDGAGDYVEVPHDASLTVDTEVTVMAWIITSRHNSGGDWQAILAKSNDPRSYSFYTYTNGTLHFSTTSEGAQVGSNSAGLVPLNEWVHVTAMVEGGQHVYYINGEPAGTGGGGITLPGAADTATVRIGLTHEGSNAFLGMIDDVRIYNKALTQEEIKQAMRGDPSLAWDPSPANSSTPDIDQALPLSWSPGDNASQHDVYFGTDKDAVEYADISDTTGIYRDRRSSTSYTPGEGAEWGTGPYYWRIDEYNTDGTISKGRLWSFTVADFISIDNIEGYDVVNQIWYNWIDGLGYVKPDNTSHPGNGTGAEVGDPDTASFTEETTVHSGGKSMPFKYNNNDPFKLKYSEVKLTLSAARDWTKQDVKALSLWFQGRPGSVGSFTDNFDGTYSMTGSGFDIWFNADGVEADEFHYAYKQLTGAGTIIARVVSVLDTNPWAKAGVMIRETLDPNSAHAFACVTPGNGVASQGRPGTGDAGFSYNQTGITAPHWVKLERDMAGNFTVSHSTNGSSWDAVEGAIMENIPMNATVYVGLALTAHDAALTCEAAFSNVTITGNVAGQWASQDIGIMSNDAEPMYVAIANNTGQPAVVFHDDPNAAQINTWTEWNIDLSDFAGINLADVNSIAVGLGNRNNPQAGGAGKMYFDDIALYRPRCVPEKVTLSEADLNSDCVVDYRDLEIMVGDWLAGVPGLAADLNVDDTVDFKDYAVLADQWLDEQIWPDL